jgi:hypothetical protein
MMIWTSRSGSHALMRRADVEQGELDAARVGLGAVHSEERHRLVGRRRERHVGVAGPAQQPLQHQAAILDVVDDEDPGPRAAQLWRCAGCWHVPAT